MAAVSAMAPSNMNTAHYMGSTSTASYLTTPTGRTDICNGNGNGGNLPNILNQASEFNPRQFK